MAVRPACKSSALAAAVLSVALLDVVPDEAGAAPAADSAHTQWYAIGTLQVATYSDGKFGPGTNCPHGGNGKWLDVQLSILQSRYGYTAERAKKVLASNKGIGLIRYRGLKDGKPAVIQRYPLSIPYNPQELVVPGGRAYGFNLDGNGSSSPNALVDPETKATDVQDNLFRVLGCSYGFNVSQQPSSYSQFSMSATWLMYVSGADLTKDGPVTIGFAKALEHALVDANGKQVRGQMYTLDPSWRNFGTLQGRLEGDNLIASGEHVSLEGGRPAVFDVTHAHLRLKRNPDGSLGGYLGGFQPWMDYWFMIAAVQEIAIGMDVSSLYYDLRRLADADPDPVTGANRRISATYRLDGLEPVYASPAPPYRAPVVRRVPDRQVVARAASEVRARAAESQVASR